MPFHWKSCRIASLRVRRRRVRGHQGWEGVGEDGVREGLRGACHSLQLPEDRIHQRSVKSSIHVHKKIITFFKQKFTIIFSQLWGRGVGAGARRLPAYHDGLGASEAQGPDRVPQNGAAPCRPQDLGRPDAQALGRFRLGE